MHICCIYIKNCYITTIKEEMDFSPLGILYISSSLKQAGYTTEIIYYNLSTKIIDVLKKIKEIDKLVLISITSESDYILSKYLITKIKKRYPKIKVGVGGAYLTLVPEEIMANKDIDMVCIGEGEIADVEYAKQVEEGKYRKTDNLWIRDNDGQIIKCDRSVVIEDPDSLPYPDRDGWDKVYNEYIYNLKYHPVLMLERGCNNRCIYCAHHALSKVQEGKYLRYRKIDKVIEELEYICSHYSNVNIVTLVADSALSDLEYFIELCKGLILFNKKRKEKNKNKILFVTSINLPTNLLKEKEYITKLMKDAGFYLIHIGLETADIEIRKKLNRPYYTNEQFIEFCRILKQVNIKFGVTIMYNPLFNTRQSNNDLINLLSKSKMDKILLSWLTAFKGTVLYEKYRDKIVSYSDARLIDKFKFYTLEYRILYKTYGIRRLINFNLIHNIINIINKQINDYFRKRAERKNEVYLERAKNSINNGQYKKAIKYFNKVKINESNYWIYGDRAVCKMNIGDYKGAIEDFDRVLKLEPKEIYKEKREECKKLLDKNRG